MTLSQIGHKIHRRESHLWIITKAERGEYPYVLQYKNQEKRIEMREKLESELRQLYNERSIVKNSTPKKEWYPGRKRSGRTTGSKSTYECSDGTRVTQKEIDKKRSEAYKEKYANDPYPRCEETGERAQCSSHIISQKRCKQLRMTELIWNTANFYPATFDANSRWESNDRTLKHYQKYMQFLKMYDLEGYNKRLI